MKNFGVALGLCLYDNEHIKTLNSIEEINVKENVASLTRSRNCASNRNTGGGVPTVSANFQKDKAMSYSNRRSYTTLERESNNLVNQSADRFTETKAFVQLPQFQGVHDRHKQLEDSLSGLKPSDFEDAEHIL